MKLLKNSIKYWVLNARLEVGAGLKNPWADISASCFKA